MELRQLPAASSRCAFEFSTWTSFSASSNVPAETSGPTGGAVPNAGGAPGVGGCCCSETSCAWLKVAAAAPITTSEVSVRNSLRDFDIVLLLSTSPRLRFTELEKIHQATFQASNCALI